MFLMSSAVGMLLLRVVRTRLSPHHVALWLLPVFSVFMVSEPESMFAPLIPPSEPCENDPRTQTVV